MVLNVTESGAWDETFNQYNVSVDEPTNQKKKKNLHIASSSERLGIFELKLEILITI